MSEAQQILTTSPTQYKTFEDLCPRKWWLRYERGCLEPERSFQGYGKVLHAVIERFLRAPQNGRDPKTGKPVEYFPEGWDQDPALGIVLPAEADQIRRLFQQAIEDGILVRPPGSIEEGDYLVEHRYTRILRPGVEEHGVIDLLKPSGIDDHKSTSKRRWALTEEKLARDAQMLSYGNVRRQVVAEGGCELQHNIFVKDGVGYVMKRHVVVTTEQLQEREEKTQETVSAMIELQKVGDLEWESVPGPREGSDACNAYGGCPYRGICSRTESINAYRLRIQRAREHKERRESMSEMSAQPAAVQRKLGDRFKKSTGQEVPTQASSSGTPPPAIPFTEIAPINPPAQAHPSPPAPLPASGEHFRPAPWFTEGCIACKTPFPGFSSSLQPCRVCEMRQRRLSPPGPLPEEYLWGVENGKPWWKEKQAEIIDIEPVVEPADLEPRAEVVQQVVQQMMEETLGEIAPPAAPKKRGRPRKNPLPPAPEQVELGTEVLAPEIPQEKEGFNLFIDCRVTSGSFNQVQIVDFATVLRDAGEELAKNQGASSYWELNAFERRDMLCQLAPQIAEQLKGKTVYTRNLSGVPDAQQLLEALRPFAKLVVEH